MTVPVVRLLLEQHPSLHVTFVSDPFMEPLFRGMERLQFVGADTRVKYKGLTGLYRLSQELKKLHRFQAVADLHNVLRTKIIRLFITGCRQSAIDKGRAEKKELTRAVNKKLRPLKSGFRRYADVFAGLGYEVMLPPDYSSTGSTKGRTGTNHLTSSGKKIIGIAPFARHLPKMYPLTLMKQVVDQLASVDNVEVILFGSKKEAGQLETWVSGNVSSVAGTISFHEELQVINTLHCMVSMDSANMHLASLFNVPVVSLWGGTHPFLGFYGWQQDPDNALQMDYPCRPSSVFGNKPCPLHGEQGCMEGITPAMVVEKVLAVAG